MYSDGAMILICRSLLEVLVVVWWSCEFQTFKVTIQSCQALGLRKLRGSFMVLHQASSTEEYSVDSHLNILMPLDHKVKRSIETEFMVLLPSKLWSAPGMLVVHR